MFVSWDSPTPSPLCLDNNLLLPSQARRPGAIVFAIVRDPAGSSHLHAAVAGLKNVHIFAGDVGEYNALEVSAHHRCECVSPLADSWFLQRAAKQVSQITGGKLDYLIHLAAKMDAGTLFRGYGD